jgi:hypothetical protein
MGMCLSKFRGLWDVMVGAEHFLLYPSSALLHVHCCSHSTPSGPHWHDLGAFHMHLWNFVACKNRHEWMSLVSSSRLLYASAQMVVRVFSQLCLSCSLYAVMPGSVAKSPLQTPQTQVRNLRLRVLHEHISIPQHSGVALVTSLFQAECASVSSYCHHLQSYVHEFKPYLHAACTSSLRVADSSAIHHNEKQTAIDIEDAPRVKKQTAINKQ